MPVALAPSIGDDAVSRRFPLFVVKIEVVEPGTLPAGLMQSASLPLIIYESAAELPKPLRMALFEPSRLADRQPTEDAELFP